MKFLLLTLLIACGPAVTVNVEDFKKNTKSTNCIPEPGKFLSAEDYLKCHPPNIQAEKKYLEKVAKEEKEEETKKDIEDSTK